MIINHNIAALNTYRQLSANNVLANKSLEKLSSGLRIVRAGDDAAGLAISEKMRGQIRGLNQASRNAQDTISLIQTAEGALNETHSILQRMRELAVQAANDTNTDADRQAIQDEINQLANEIDRIANTTEFNTKKLLNGEVVGVVAEKKGTYSIQANSAASLSVTASGAINIANKGIVNGAITITRISEATNGEAAYEFRNSLGEKIASANITVSTTNKTFTFAAGEIASGAAVTFKIDDFAKFKSGDSFTIILNKHVAASTDTSKAIITQIGANSGQNMLIGINDMRAEALGIKNSSGDAVKVTDKYGANAVVSTINNAIEKVSTERSKLGAIQNRLEHTINNLGTAAENLTASESRIRDVDMAKEMMEYTKLSILQQAATAMLAQANQQPQMVLQLLR
ncbi:flagellin N-terminal helical domain-containing protein [Desulfofundulus thermosubterraneus]|uniref:Flagellin n=1 Tax=Desulfofundulus thermosubterraneus DSM 16057 TaxID=1121432 RepID=A0A1M6K292_9FIRM|nr:flagellin [Desulfofundulus thermosubterraneus]SHJ53044.1 flagellin [Desulfofundulus thermosubterraneus DSM 16057]